MGIYTVRLKDSLTRRIVLDEVSASSATAAAAAAIAAPPISGPAATFTAGNVVDQAAVLAISGKDNAGNPSVAPTSLPVIPETTASSVLL